MNSITLLKLIMETTKDCQCSVCDKPLVGSAKKSRKLLYGSSTTAVREILQPICRKESGKSLDSLISPTTGPFLCRVCERQLLRVLYVTKSAEQYEKCIGARMLLRMLAKAEGRIPYIRDFP